MLGVVPKVWAGVLSAACTVIFNTSQENKGKQRGFSRLQQVYTGTFFFHAKCHLMVKGLVLQLRLSTSTFSAHLQFAQLLKYLTPVFAFIYLHTSGFYVLTISNQIFLH